MRYVCAMAVEHEDSVEKVLHSSSSAAQSFVAASWCRSGLKYGLDAGADQGRELVSGSELTQRRERHGLMLEVARPLLDQLFQTVAATGCAIMLSDKDGVILESRSQTGDRVKWSERHARPCLNGLKDLFAERRMPRQVDGFGQRYVGTKPGLCSIFLGLEPVIQGTSQETRPAKSGAGVVVGA